MTLGEFRAWLNGYECSFDLNADGYWPNAKQFTEIKNALAMVDKPTSDRYVFNGPPTPWPPAIGPVIATNSNMDDWDNRNIYNQFTGKPI